VNFDLSDEQRLLQDTARDWFGGRFAPADMRRALDGAAAADPAAALGEMGFMGMLVDSAHGGGGLSVLDLAVVAEEAGRALAAVPLVSTAAQAVTLLRGAGGSEAEALLEHIAAGREVVAVLSGATADGGGLSGLSAPALDAARATCFLVGTGSGASSRLFLVQPGASATPVSQAAMDPTRALARVQFEGAPGVELGSGAGVGEAIDRARHVAMTVLAAEDLGAASRCLDIATEYAKQRVAFGRPIGSFQAVKHACVDMFVLVEQLRSLVWYAAWAANADARQLPLAATAARAYAADAFEQCAASCIQVHGGIGFTWEHDAHLFWRRAKVDRLLYGDAASQRDAVARLALAAIA